MRRRRFRKPALSLSLFPFLAVLVCTMGALIVLLVTVVQKARVDVDRSAAQRNKQQAAAEAELGELRQEKEVHEWRRQVLETQLRAIDLDAQRAALRLRLSTLIAE